MEAAIRNPAVAVRQSALLLPLPFGAQILERITAIAPDEAMAMTARYADFRAAMSAGSPRMHVLAELAADRAHDLPARRRTAPLAGAIARGGISREAAWRLVASASAYFARLADLREAAVESGESDEAAGFARALETESVTACRAAQESGGRTLARDLAGLRATDVYLLLAYGGADCTAVFPEAFDRELIPRLRRSPLTPFLERTGNWQLREFTAAALDGGRFEAFLPLAGSDALAKLALGIDDVNDAVEVAEMVGASGDSALTGLVAQAVVREFARVRDAQDRRGEIVYGLLAARVLTARSPRASDGAARRSDDAAGRRLDNAEALQQAGARYVPLLESSAALDAAQLFDSGSRCVQRYFFWDDDDGVESFANFRKGYEGNAAWKIEDRGAYVHLTGSGAAGRTIEIFANVPINIRLPANRAREGEAQRRQEAIAAELAQRGLTPSVLVHRGHSFHVEKTLGYVTPAARLVVLGSCRGVIEIHRVIEASHQAQVIATRGVGATEINDYILRGLNARLLSEGGVRWAEFWREQQGKSGRSALFQQYITPDRDEAAAFLRAYYQALDEAVR